MAIIWDSLSGVANTASQFRSGHKSGVFSDSKLWTIIRTDLGGGNFKWQFYTSVDGGDSWSADLTLVASSPQTAIYPSQFSDKIYISLIEFAVTNKAVKFSRVSYAGGVLTLEADQVTLRAADVLRAYDSAHISREPTSGRLWAGTGRFAGDNEITIMYSDDNGDTWATSIDFATVTGCGASPSILSFDLATVVIYTTNIPPPGFYSRARLHSDAVGTWDALTIRLSAGDLGRCWNTPQGCLIDASPARIGLFTDRDKPTPAAALIYGLRVNQDGAGALTYTSLGSVSVAEDVDLIAQVSGRTNGWKVHYLRSTSLTVMRWFDVISSAVGWPTEQTSTAPAAFFHFHAFSTPRTLPFAYDTAAHLIVGQTAGDAQTGREGLVSNALNIDALIPLKWRTIVNLDSLIPLLHLLRENFDSTIPIEWDFQGAMRAQFDIPILHILREGFNSIIPLLFGLPGVSSFDHVIPILHRLSLQTDIPIPILFQLLEDWVRQDDSETDIWVKQDASQTDAFTADPASEPDTWSTV